MTSLTDNPQAFPVLIENWRGEVRAEMKGMTLRDYFAAAALPHAARLSSDQWNRYEGETVAQTMARHSYEIAEAMLKAREASHD